MGSRVRQEPKRAGRGAEQSRSRRGGGGVCPGEAPRGGRAGSSAGGMSGGADGSKLDRSRRQSRGEAGGVGESKGDLTYVASRR
jgi:hypothetical protein